MQTACYWQNILILYHSVTFDRLLEYQFGMDHCSVLIVSKICDWSVKIKNSKNKLVLFKDKCLGLALLLSGHIKWFAFFVSLIIVEVNGKPCDKHNQ